MKAAVEELAAEALRLREQRDRLLRKSRRVGEEYSAALRELGEADAKLSTVEGALGHMRGLSAEGGES